MLAFGDPGPFAERVRSAGVKLIVQVTTIDEAKRALEVGADVIVAQGSEAGGHGGRRATLPFVPAVVDLVSPTPVQQAYREAAARDDLDAISVWASEALDTIIEAAPAADTVADLVAGAERALASVGNS